MLEPGESIYNLMSAVFPNERLMLKEHFRCVEPIIRFSMRFYPEEMLPLRVSGSAANGSTRRSCDIYLPHGSRARHRKVNEAEADVIVDEIAALTARAGDAKANDRSDLPDRCGTSGAHPRQAIQTVGEEVMQRHAILCGDSATSRARNGHRFPIYGR